MLQQKEVTWLSSNNKYELIQKPVEMEETKRSHGYIFLAIREWWKGLMGFVMDWVFKELIDFGCRSMLLKRFKVLVVSISLRQYWFMVSL